MKNLFHILAIVAAVLFTACDDLDHAIADHDDRLDQLEQLSIKGIEEKVTAINAELESIRQQIADAGNEQDTAYDELAQLIEAQKEALEQAKEDLAAACEQDIADAVTDLEEKISELENDIEDLLDELKGEVAALKNRIQSIRFIPEYSDGKVELLDAISLDFMLAPKAAAGEVTEGHVTAFISRTKTRAADEPTALEVVSVTGDATTGVLNVVVSTASLPQEFLGEIIDANIFICISDGNNDIISEMIPIVSMERLDTEEELVVALETGEAKIEDDITITSPITIPAALTKAGGTNEVVIDLNGHELSYTSTVQGEAMITNNGNLTIKDSKTGGKLSFIYAGDPDTNYGKGNYTIANNGDLTVEGGLLTVNAANTTDKTKFPHALYVVDNHGKMTITGGKIYNGNNIAMRMWVNSETASTDLKVNGGEIEGVRAINIQLPSSNTALAPLCEMNITNGTLTSWADETDDDGYKLAIFSTGSGANRKNVKINISGGTFNGDVILTEGQNKTEIEKVTVTGGTFNGLYNAEYEEGTLLSYGDDATAAKAIQITGGTFSDMLPLKYMGSGESTTVKLAEDFLTKNDYKININSGATVTLDLNGKTVSHKSTKTGANVDFIDVRGTLTVKNGTITTEHIGTNMGWNSSTNVFNVTAGGVLNIQDAVCKNLGGSDMNFVAHLNNWGEVTLNVEDSELEASYVAVRVFNSGYDKNNVTIKNTVLTAGRCIWVHNYTIEDFGTQEKVDSQKALLNFNDILNAGNTFNYTKAAIRLGFTNAPEYDENGNLL